IGIRQVACRRLSDMADAEGVDEPVQRHAAPGLDGFEKVLYRLSAIALLVDELIAPLRLAPCKPENIRRLPDAPLVVEGFDLLLPEPFDVEGIARNEMPKPLLRLRRADEASGAAPHGIRLTGARVYLAHGMATADRAPRRKYEG